ncbi:alpha-L-fucosidase isoform X2 [Orussus abietinus]|uniref:alpha-L-fucosidase isoform X2 n=1 Tax=Orussus abietinus TaxID=222816 RepID=UPI000625ACDF|nr:alpha-L-fucosidase isoform X2 [Orussus abietinus]
MSKCVIMFIQLCAILLCGFTLSNALESNLLMEEPLYCDSSKSNSCREKFEEYKPTWKSLDTRPIPDWYDNAKFGIFIHWGVFSVPSFGSEWFWNYWRENGTTKYSDFMKKQYASGFTYQEFAPLFTAELFNASEWTELFQASGAKYVVLTSKHHDGFTLWPSKYTYGWNSVDVGPHKDLVGELAETIRNESSIKFGLYHSMYEWYHPFYLADKENNFTTNVFATQKSIPELYRLTELYKPEVIWSDGDWEASDSYWTSKEFLAWLYNESPVRTTVVANDRWGKDTPCHHGDFLTCKDRYNPGVLQPHKWENCLSIDKISWGFRREAVLKDYLTLHELLEQLVSTVSCGGNLLVNIGPTKDGRIIPIFEERLRGMGAWLSINGEAIYDTKPWSVQNDTLMKDTWYTQSKDEQKLYAIFLSWPKDNILQLSAVKLPEKSQIFLLGYKEIQWKQTDKYLKVILPVEQHQGKPAWVIRIQQ